MAMDAQEVLQKIPGRGSGESGVCSAGPWPCCVISKMTSGPGRMIERVLKEGYESYLQSKYPDYESRTG